MASTSRVASRRSLRPHTAGNVRENARRARERLLARQAELEKLSAPIHAAAEKLAKLDSAVSARADAPLKKIERLEKARDRKIEKIRQEYAAKIAAVREELESDAEQMTPAEREQEEMLLREYADAIVAFSGKASAAELAPLLGVSVREAKKIIEQARADLGITGDSSDSAEPSDEDRPVSVAVS
ncbi:hypothetical protein AB0P13_23175 [Rhodococcus pyridinivorans]|uniref:hypothetical protein n=1 Tax=Rhodococcus TaxID=1827 RepID=UPI0009348C24|nr:MULTISPECIES: hypothetical protein [Rhodococcus]WKK14689.1 hypothetical protein QYN14_26330 [Rhodococcus ruber]